MHLRMHSNVHLTCAFLSVPYHIYCTDCALHHLQVPVKERLHYIRQLPRYLWRRWGEQLRKPLARAPTNKDVDRPPALVRGWQPALVVA